MVSAIRANVIKLTFGVSLVKIVVINSVLQILKDFL